MARPTQPSGINSAPPPADDATVAATAHHYLERYEEEFKRARRTVKRRASGVTITVAILTGALAALGSVGALIATDWLSATIAIATTVTSATIAVLLAWNDHFHHRELWIQRSAVLSEINELRRQFTIRSKLPWYLRRSKNAEARSTMQKLDAILKRDLETWTQIQTNKRANEGR